MLLVCMTCEVEFDRPQRKIDARLKAKGRQSSVFCSRKCKDLAFRVNSGIDIQRPAHFGTGKGWGIGKRYRGEVGCCERCGYDDCVEILVIHHKDRDRCNNIRKNLEVLCPNCHAVEHYDAKDGWYK